MKRLMVIFCAVFNFCAVADETETQSVTNLLITSEAVEMKGWTRQHVMADKDNKPVNDQGKLAAYADAVAQGAVAGEIEKQSGVISNAMVTAIQGLTDVTNQVPSNAVHIAVYLPRLTAADNLVGEVISETTTGYTDTQTVRYNQRLMLPPNRFVEYVSQGMTSRVACVWHEPWDTNSLVHVCTIKRPVTLANMRCRTYVHERFGGDKGFDFGSAIVTVNGLPTFTGEVTNLLTGVVWQFRNGVKLESATAQSEE